MMSNIINKSNALLSLVGASGWMIRGDTVEWLGETKNQPTEADITAEVLRLQAVYDSQEYARLRKVKYDLLNQDEMRYDDVMNNTNTWTDTIMAIKEMYPK